MDLGRIPNVIIRTFYTERAVSGTVAKNKNALLKVMLAYLAPIPIRLTNALASVYSF